MEENEKVCPFTGGGPGEGRIYRPCHPKCALYDQSNHRCSLVTIASGIEWIGESLNTLTTIQIKRRGY